MKKLIVIATSALLFSCTEKARTRRFGGTENVQLKPNEKLINITWKETNMWVLTEDTVTHVKYFRESSRFGIWEGEVIIK